MLVLYWSWPSVRNSWKIMEGPISVGGIPAVLPAEIPDSGLLRPADRAGAGLLIRDLRGWPLPTPPTKTRHAHEPAARSPHVRRADRRHPARLPVSFSIAGVATLFAFLGYFTGQFDISCSARWRSACSG
jgi:hypothetical protein